MPQIIAWFLTSIVGGVLYFCSAGIRVWVLASAVLKYLIHFIKIHYKIFFLPYLYYSYQFAYP